MQADRFLEEIECADLRGLDCGLDRAVPRHHDHGHRELARCRPLPQQRDAVGIRHPDIEQHERWPLPGAIGAGGSRIFGETHAIAFVLEDLGQELANADFVVDDENFFGGRHEVRILRRGGAARENERYPGAARRCVGELDAAMVLVDDLLHDGEA